jgi:NTE family protein
MSNHGIRDFGGRERVERLLRPGRKTVAYLPGGGITGALFQLGALAALEDAGFGFSVDALDGFVGVGSGAVVSASFAGGLSVQRLYRGLLDPADTLFPLERRHILTVDLGEWRRAIAASSAAMRRMIGRITSKPVETASDPWSEIDRFYDVLPAGIFTLEPLERFLDAFFERRGVPLTFRALAKRLIIPAHDLDTGEVVAFGADGHRHERIARACCASMALPLFYAPVRMSGRLYFAGSTGNASALTLAVEELGAEVIVVVDPLVPIEADATNEALPNARGSGNSVADKGLLWVYNQAMRIGEHARLEAELALLSSRHPHVEVLVVKPAPSDAVLFLHAPMNYAVRRTILEGAYRSVRARAASTTSLRPPSVP